ncbi:MAG: carboxypeptidase regulatory-like domain-containing protein, partial [Desulfobacterales bacterium]|nr:carboxypeptidase regulatory-like domain-containing protein [Desulfobacterales bacterium]
DGDETLDIMLDPLPAREIRGVVAGLAPGKTAAITVWSASASVSTTVNLSGSDEPVSYTATDLKPADDYLVELIAEDSPYQVYNNKNRMEDADYVDLTLASAEGVDFTISQDVFTIEGVVNFPDGAAPGESARVDVTSESLGVSAGVSVRAPGSLSATWVITGLEPADDYIALVQSDGYPNHYYNGADGGTADPAGATRLDGFSGVVTVNFTLLSTGAEITGRVSAPTRSAGGVSGITVEAWSESAGSLSSGATAADGSFIIKGLAEADDYTLEFRVPDMGSFFYNEERMVRRSSLATRIAAVAGVSLNIDVALPSVGSITGRVTDLNDLGLALIWVEADSESQMCGGGAFTDDDGQYEITGLTLGNDYLVAARPDWETNPIEKPDNAVGDVVNFILEVGAGYTVAGVVKDAAGEPVSDVRVEAWSEALEIRGEMWSVTDRNGKYEFTGLPEAADYQLLAHPPEDSGLAFHQEAGVSVTGDLEMEEIVLQSAGAIEGRVVDGVTNSALEGVVIIAVSPQNSFYADTVTDHTGAYKVTGVPNGVKYDVTAKLDSYIGRTIRNQAPETGVDFDLYGSAAIRGVVRNKISGQVIAGARVEARSATRQNNRGYSGVAFTDADGAYEIKGLMMMDPTGNPVDDYVITAYADGWPAASTGGRSAGEEIDFSLARGPENRLAGAIENAAGADVIVEIYDGNGFVTWTAAADGEFEFTDLAPDGEYFMRFTSYEGDVETNVQWASASGAPDHDIGAPDGAGDATPAAAKRYTPGGPPVHFRFSDAAAAANRRGGARPGMVSFLDSTTHVAHSTP